MQPEDLTQLLQQASPFEFHGQQCSYGSGLRPGHRLTDVVQLLSGAALPSSSEDQSQTHTSRAYVSQRIAWRQALRCTDQARFVSANNWEIGSPLGMLGKARERSAVRMIRIREKIVGHFCWLQVTACILSTPAALSLPLRREQAPAAATNSPARIWQSVSPTSSLAGVLRVASISPSRMPAF